MPPVAPLSSSQIGLDALELARPDRATSAAGPAASFGDALGQALTALDEAQLEGDRNAEAVALGGGNLHETALALEKADTTMRVAVKVRNKVVDAYQEIMRMSV